MLEKNMMEERKVPSLVDLCVQTAVDNLSYLGDVGDTDLSFLGRILPHCTVKQLMRIENSTKGRDLSPVTNKLWKNFYELKFGDKSTNPVTNKLWKNFYGLQFGAKSTKIVVERMKRSEVSFIWEQLYEAKLKDLKEAQQKSFDRIESRNYIRKKMPGNKVVKFSFAPRFHLQEVKEASMEVLDLVATSPIQRAA